MTRLLPVILAMSALPSEGDPPTFLRTPPTAPAAATATFRTLHRFRMEPIAAEPLVFDPVAAAYDEDGRLYVAEMSDYPHVEAKNDKPFSENTLDPPVGRLKLPVDRDGDGTFDTATVLADKLSWPTGLAIWKGGAFVAATPAIWCIKDAGGDGRVEVRERAYEGPRKFNIQAAMNNLRWGLDYAIYGAGSANGGEVRRSDRRRRRPSRSSGGISSSTPRRGRSRRSRAGHGSVTPSTIGEIGSSATSATRPSMSSCPPATWRGIPDWRPPRALHDAARAGDAIPMFRISPPEPWREFRARRWSANGRALPRSELVGAGYLTCRAASPSIGATRIPPSIAASSSSVRSPTT